MRVSISFLAFALASLAAAAPRDGGRTCASKPSAEFLAKSAEFALKEANGELVAPQATIEVETYFHVVASGMTVADGYITVRPYPGSIVIARQFVKVWGRTKWLRTNSES